MSYFGDRCVCAFVIVCALFPSIASVPAQAQPSEAQMEKALDVMDKPPSWNGPAQGDALNPNQMPPDMVHHQTSSSMTAASPVFNSPQMLMPQAAVSNPFTLQNALRIMLGGSSSTSSSAAGVSGNDSENLQTALDQNQQAIDACNNISGERDKGVKEGLASQAQNHANAARYAADALYNSSSNSKSQEVHNMAARARNAANEAQSFADRARSKADGGGW